MISVCGNVKRPGVFEVPFGITIREIVYDLVSGMESEDYPLRLVQLGGASGRICSPPNWTLPTPTRACVRRISPPSAPARCWWWMNAPASSAFCA
ncbi:SLBB domain-containing protein [Flavonifractor plautii]|nr:SLBB domain-containing protein [Flavonifractor plautii]